MDLVMNIRHVLPCFTQGPALSCILPPKNSLSWNDLSTINVLKVCYVFPYVIVQNSLDLYKILCCTLECLYCRLLKLLNFLVHLFEYYYSVLFCWSVAEWLYVCNFSFLNCIILFKLEFVLFWFIYLFKSLF